MSCTCEQLAAKLASIESMLNDRLSQIESRLESLEARVAELEKPVSVSVDITQAVRTIFGV